ncbi:MAG: long-chain-acyl-CoA synthetase [Steroidobacteraceae bacterium]
MDVTIREASDGMGTALQAWTRALERTASIGRDPAVILPTLVEAVAQRLGTAPALLADEQQLTYAALAERAHRYARWALAEGVTPGDVIGLLMPNGPDYVALWLGLTRVGAVVSLLTPTLLGDSLAHAVHLAAPKHLIVAGELDAAARAALGDQPTLRRWAHGTDCGGAPRVELAAGSLSGAPLSPDESRIPALRDRALLIYTSGTTGLPKAAQISHRRMLQWSLWFAGMMNTGPSDRLYNCLPMYHSVGGIVAVGSMLVGGGSVIIRKRFSLRRFWDDITDSRCTLFQYIGELCRYLATSAPHPREREHTLRLCCGNGMRADVWERFQERFAIPRILEFYAATEANFSLYNCEGRRGAIGRVPPFLAHRLPIVLVRVDAATGEPMRGADGLCIRCGADEPGEALSEIQESANPASRFEGYTDAAASDRKVLRSVLSAGDAWYRSGDLLRRDRAGYFYFVDRIGATFRWKGENVSTTEVAEVIASCPGVMEAVVYGVQVPGADGRAGMAAIVVDGDFDPAGLRNRLREQLPDYARPLFLRVLRRIETTGTFKPRVQEYAAAGFDPAVIADPLFVDDRDHGAFIPLDAAAFARIQACAHKW